MLRGILKACEKRPVKKDKVNEIVDKIELAIMNSGKRKLEMTRGNIFVLEVVVNQSTNVMVMVLLNQKGPMVKG